MLTKTVSKVSELCMREPSDGVPVLDLLLEEIKINETRVSSPQFRD